MKHFLFCSFFAFAFSQLILRPTDDTYLDETARNTVRGLQSTGLVFQDIYNTGGRYNLLSKYNISSLAGMNISSCEVRFQQWGQIDEEFDGPYIQFDVYLMSTNWTETTATWNNAPAALSATPFLDNYQDGDVFAVKFPCTQQVQDAVNSGAQFVSFMVAKTGYPYVGLFMDEFQNGIYSPLMTVYYTQAN